MRILIFVVACVMCAPCQSKTLEITGRVSLVVHQGEPIDVQIGDQVVAWIQFPDELEGNQEPIGVTYRDIGSFRLELGDYSYRQDVFNYAATPWGHFMNSESLATLNVDGRRVSSTSLRFGPQPSESIYDLEHLLFETQMGFFSVLDGPTVEYEIVQISEVVEISEPPTGKLTALVSFMFSILFGRSLR